METAQTFTIIGDKKVQETLSKLKFISKLQQGEKVNVKDLFIRDNDSIVQRILRTFKNYSTYISGSTIVESKEATLLFIQESVNEAITLITLYSANNAEPFQKHIAEIITQNLDISKQGIRNSIDTYKQDRKFMSEAEAVIQTLEARIKNLKEKGYMQSLTDTPMMSSVKCEDADPRDCYNYVV